MNLLRKLPNSRREPPGAEWTVLRKLPVILLGGTLAPAVASVASRLFTPEGTATEVAKRLQMVDILAIATVITVWTAVFTVAIACVVVWLMKGPGYVADAYDLSDADEPRSDRESGRH